LQIVAESRLRAIRSPDERSEIRDSVAIESLMRPPLSRGSADWAVITIGCLQIVAESAVRDGQAAREQDEREEPIFLHRTTAL